MPVEGGCSIHKLSTLDRSDKYMLLDSQGFAAEKIRIKALSLRLESIDRQQRSLKEMKADVCKRVD